MPKIKYKPQFLPEEQPSLGAEVLCAYGRGKIVGMTEVQEADDSTRTDTDGDIAMNIATDEASSCAATAINKTLWRIVVRLVSWQLAPRVLNLDDLLNENNQQQQHQSFVTLYYYFSLPLSDNNESRLSSSSPLRVVRPPLEAKEYPTTAERALRVHERKLFAMERMQQAQDLTAATKKNRENLHDKMTQEQSALSVSGDDEKALLLQTTVTDQYTLALEALDEAMQLIRTLLYDQSKLKPKQLAEQQQLPVNVSRALLILTCIQCCNHAAACALQLSQWQLAISHAMQALTLLQKMKESSSSKNNNTKNRDSKQSSRSTKAAAAGDLKLFGVVRVQSLKRVARAMVALRQKPTAIQLLGSAMETCQDYQARQIEKQLYTTADMERLVRQQGIVQRMLDKLLPTRTVKTKKKSSSTDRIKITTVNLSMDGKDNHNDSNSIRGFSLASGHIDENNVDDPAKPLLLQAPNVMVDPVVSDDDDDSILSMSSMSASHDDERSVVVIAATAGVPSTPATKRESAEAPAIVTPDNSVRHGADSALPKVETATLAEASTLIQSIARGYCCRLALLQQEELRRCQAATRGQSAVRAMNALPVYLVEIEEERGQKAKAEDMASIMIQKAARGMFACVAYRSMLLDKSRRETRREGRAAIKIQSVVRGLNAQRDCRARLERKHQLEIACRSDAVKTIQSTWRAIVAQRHYRLRLVEELRRNNAAFLIQMAARRKIACNDLVKRKQEKQHFEAAVHEAAAILIQSVARGASGRDIFRNKLEEKQQREAAQRADAATTIQTVCRTKLARDFLRTKRDDKENRDSSQRHGASLIIRNAVRNYFANVAAKKLLEERQKAEELLALSTKLGAVTRGFLERYSYRKFQENKRRQHAREDAASVSIQTTIRGFLSRSAYEKLAEEKLRLQATQRYNAAVAIQNKIRACSARRQFLASLISVILVQSIARRIIQMIRYENIRRDEKAATTIQSIVRHRAARIRYIHKRKSLVTIQSAMRLLLQRMRYITHIAALKKLQTWFRCTLAFRHMMRQKASVIYLQSIARAGVQRRRYQMQVQATKRLQSSLRCTLALRELTRRKASVTKLQSMARAIAQRREYTKQIAAVTHLQNAMRCNLAIRNSIQRKSSVAKIQSVVRGSRQQKKYAKQQEAALTVQSCARRLRAQKEQTSRSAAAIIQKSWRGAIVRLEQAEKKESKIPHLRRTSSREMIPPSAPTPAVQRYTDFWKDKEAKAGYKKISVTDWQKSPAAFVAKEVKFANVSSPSAYTGEMHVTSRQSLPLNVISRARSNDNANWADCIDVSQPGKSFAGLKAMHESWSGSLSGDMDRNKNSSARACFPATSFHSSWQTSPVNKLEEHSVFSFQPFSFQPDELGELQTTREISAEITFDATSSQHLSSGADLLKESAQHILASGAVPGEANSGIGGSLTFAQAPTLSILATNSDPIACSSLGEAPLATSIMKDSSLDLSLDDLYGELLVPATLSHVSGDDEKEAQRINENISEKHKGSSNEIFATSHGFSLFGSEASNLPGSANTVALTDEEVYVATPRNAASASAPASVVTPDKTPDDSWRDKLQARVNKLSTSSSMASFTSKSSRYVDDAWRDKMKVHVDSANASIASHGSRVRQSKPVTGKSGDGWRDTMKVFAGSANTSVVSIGSSNSKPAYATPSSDDWHSSMAACPLLSDGGESLTAAARRTGASESVAQILSSKTMVDAGES